MSYNPRWNLIRPYIPWFDLIRPSPRVIWHCLALPNFLMSSCLRKGVQLPVLMPLFMSVDQAVVWYRVASPNKWLFFICYTLVSMYRLFTPFTIFTKHTKIEYRWGSAARLKWISRKNKSLSSNRNHKFFLACFSACARSSIYKLSHFLIRLINHLSLTLTIDRKSVV